MSSGDADTPSNGAVTPLRMLILVSASVFWGAAIAVIVPFFVALLTEVNLRLAPDVPWFVIPALVIAVGTVLASKHWCKVIEKSPAWPVWQSLLTSVLIAVAMTVFAIATMGMAALRSGQWSLPGDLDAAPGSWRIAKALTNLFTAGLIEEAAMRGGVQLRLQRAVGPIWSELIAGLEFVLLHGFRFSTAGELPLVIVTAIANGRLTSVTQDTRYPAFAHALGNLLIAAVVLYLRSN